MWTGRFELREGMVRVDGLLHGPLGARGVRFILDTGCPFTLIDTAIAKMKERSCSLSSIVVG